MKKIIVLVSIVFIGVLANAQKIITKESKENIAGAIHNSIVVNLFEINPSDAEDAFKSFMKKYDGKRSSKDGNVFIDHALVKEIGNNTIDIYGKANGKKGDKEINFIIAFDLGGAYINSSDHKDQFKVAEKIAKEFAVKATKDAIEEQLKESKKVQSKLEDKQKDLESENKNLNDDILKYKEKIKKSEDDIVRNKSDQEKKNAEIEVQKKVVGDIEIKLKAVE